MLAQIKSSDDDVWASLKRSGHLEGSASEALTNRLTRMRAWVEGTHFPEDARVSIRAQVDDDVRGNLDEGARALLSGLADSLVDCEWSDNAIGECIRVASDVVGIDRREAYVALYWVLLGRSHGPKASSIIAEMTRDEILSLLSSV